MKSKALRETAGELNAKLEQLTLQCRQDGRAPTEAEQAQFLETRAEVTRLLSEADGLDMLDGYESDKLSRLNRGGVALNPHVNTRNKADSELAIRSFLGKSAGLSCSEWDAHADQLGMGGRVITRAFSTTGAGLGAEFIPTTLGDTVYEKLIGYGGLLTYLAANDGTFTNSTGEPFNFPIFDATGNIGGLVAENTADNTTDLATGSKAFSSYPYSSGIQKISFQSIRDSKFPLKELVSKGLGYGLGRNIASVLINGTGTSQPEGLLTNVVTGVTTASPTTFTYQEIASLPFTVNEPHASRGVFMVARSAVQTLVGLTDTIGRPLWIESIRQGVPATLLGYPVYVDLGMPTVAAGHTPIVFGDIASGFKLRLVGDLVIRASDERYFEFNQSAVVANQYIDSRAIDLDCYKCLKMHA